MTAIMYAKDDGIKKMMPKVTVIEIIKNGQIPNIL